MLVHIYGVWCKTELFCVGLFEPWPRYWIYNSFLFVVGDLDGHHQEWLGFTFTTRVLQPLTWDCVWLWSVSCWPDLCMWWNPDLLMTDISHLVQLALVGLMGNLDYSSLLAVILMALAVPNVCVSKRFLKCQINRIVVQYWLRFLIGIYPAGWKFVCQPKPSVCTTIISLVSWSMHACFWPQAHIF